MIVRSVDKGWRVVFHTSHGLLAQRIASHLDAPRDLPFWFETQVAIGSHDDLHRVYRAGEREHLTAAGAPRDFTLVPMRNENREIEMRDRIDEAYRKHSWIGLLQSKHADFLYDAEDVTQEMIEMLESERRRRSDVMSSLGVDESVLQQSYDWMRFCDRFSLILCGNDVPAMSRRLEIITNSLSARFEVWQDADELIHVDPWPFVSDRVKLPIECRTLNQLSFVDDAELGKMLIKAATETCQFDGSSRLI